MVDHLTAYPGIKGLNQCDQIGQNVAAWLLFI
jgi:hypothetical protein